ncbi:tripartite tricarboxylate transporter substrate binding protein [Bordetella sp. 15P40C-2]|uniref:Bug family tripartite tricarboxylate transporter substrate binding protein n=1 Tax=Bordetella sp. 15P40C-2 TaxID=2572246 RepID=UPI00132567A6|nr:tripartite tricarboxylate transporter substrate binding protein [Bordetella sp. 15P40C-2]MVW73036.1 tripartite tricarboxylate transporter substrate binding protein [Bordetella sp. 15P40C-2]
MTGRAFKRFFGTLLVTSFAATAAMANNYPSQPIRIVVGYAAGGTTDILARVLGEQLSKELKQPVIIENKPGAAGNIAATYVQDASPDGYTLFIATVASHGINPALYKRTLGYDPIKGFEPVGMVAAIPLLLVADPKLGVDKVQALVSLAKSKPGDLNYSSSGNGSPVHLAGAMFAQQANLDLVHIPYRGGALANTAVMSGDAQFSFATLPGAMPQVRANKLVPLAVTTRDRSPQLPDVPALAEIDGFAGYEINTWNALLAPKGTPAGVINTLSAALNAAMKSPTLRQHFEKEGAVPAQSTPAELSAFIPDELKKWAGVVESVNIRVD